MCNWSKSNIEEMIGVLWFILTALLIQNGEKKLWIATLIMGIVSLTASIIYSVLSRYKEKLKKQIEALKESNG